MKNRLKKAFAALLGLIFILSSLTGCASKQEAASGTDADTSDSVIYRTVDEIKQSGTINIGVFSDKSPFGYVDENGEYQGYDVYFGNRIGQDLGVAINYISTEAANRIEYLQTGKVDIILANFTVTEERAQEVDFALPYMNVALGVVSPDSAVITSLDEIGADDEVIVISGTTAETYLEKNHPNIKLQKYDAYAEAKTAFENGNGVAWANDNTEVIAFAIENPGYTVGIPSLGSADTIAAAVTKGNETLLNWLNDEIVALGKENFFHADYEATLLDTYGADYEDTLVVEGGVVSGATAATEPESKGTITVAASPTPHAEILAEAAKLLPHALHLSAGHKTALYRPQRYSWKHSVCTIGCRTDHRRRSDKRPCCQCKKGDDRSVKKALIAMSGGVDSSVAAMLMKKQGFHCIGCTMKLYHNEDIGLDRGKTCCSLDDVEDARSVAYALNIPYYVFNFSSDFKEQIIARFVHAYETGVTPNPCIDCNRYMKFEKLFARAGILGCDYIVTGHYARIAYDGEKYLLKKAVDETKDQSYVLYSMTQQQLAHTVFPLGSMQKTQVRKMAEENGFINAKKTDSQDICFVPDGDYASFIERYRGKTYTGGDFINTSGAVLGQHRGIIHYTVGQRKGLGVSFGKPMYVKCLNANDNTVTLCENQDLYSDALLAEHFHWISGSRPEKPIRCKVKIRYRQPEQAAVVEPIDDTSVRVVFDLPQRAITPGQAAVLYDKDIVLGGGIIKDVE